MSDDIRFLPSSTKNPFILTLKSLTDTQIVFDGYWYLEKETLPVRRILRKDARTHLLVEFTEKETLEDTSGDGTEDDPIFFPTAILKLTFKVIKDLEDDDTYDAIYAEIVDEEKDVEIRDLEHRRLRQEKEKVEMLEMIKHMDFKSFFKGSK